MEKFNFEVDDWKWWSKILRITAGSNHTRHDLIAAIDKLEKLSIRNLYIYVDENILKEVIQILIDKKYIFRAYVDNTYQYYKWLLASSRGTDGCAISALANIEDKVHPYATSTAGVSAMILSPDELSVLLIFENNNWKFVSGSNNFKELSFDTAKREMFEEVGLINDDGFIPKIIGFWNIADNMNDMMTSYVLRAMPNCQIKMDEFELVDAKWFKISDLKPIIDIAVGFKNSPCGITDPHDNYIVPLNNHIIIYNDQNYGYPYMLWINNWLQKKYYDNCIVRNVNIIC